MFNEWRELAAGYIHMNRLSSRINRLQFKTSGDSPIGLEESREYTPIFINKD